MMHLLNKLLPKFPYLFSDSFFSGSSTLYRSVTNDSEAVARAQSAAMPRVN